MIALMMVAVLAASAICLIANSPSAAAADENPGLYSDIRASKYMTGASEAETAMFTIYAVGGDDDVTYRARIVDGNGVSSGSVSPSSGTVDIEGTELNVTAPSEPGYYELVVDFTFTVDDETVTITKRAPLKVLTPITLSVVVYNNGGTVVNMEVYFEVDGVKVEGSDNLITIEAGKNSTVSYDWYTEGLSGREHTMMLVGTVGQISENISGLNTPVKFYVGQQSYALVEALVVILFIVLIIVMIWIYRKPVKNVGKPKARR